MLFRSCFWFSSPHTNMHTLFLSHANILLPHHHRIKTTTLSLLLVDLFLNSTTMTHITFDTTMPLSIISTAPQCPAHLEPLTSEELRRRKHFCIFLKILSHHLTKTNPSMKQQVKDLVRLCTKKNREGDIKFENLMESVQQRLRQLVGIQSWKHYQTCTECYLLSQIGKGDGMHSGEHV